jgi:hypothetical protein
MALVGLLLCPGGAARARSWLLLGVIALASLLALFGLYVTGGYCAPRHALVLALVLIAAAAHGINRTIAAANGLLAQCSEVAAWWSVGPIAWAAVLGGLGWFYAPRTLAPVNEGFGGYRAAGRWLHEHATPGSRVVDVSGWALFYGSCRGYTFEDLIAAPGDPAARWVVAREAHLRGPWSYCAILRDLVGDAEPVAVFHGTNPRHATKVFVFDRRQPHAAAAPEMAAPGAGAVRR